MSSIEYVTQNTTNNDIGELFEQLAEPS
eukprot:SAG11_NODE_7315_length_1162_cov_1.517404_2_plen_27_part_01